MVDATGVRGEGTYGVGEAKVMMKDGEHEDRGEVKVDGDEDDARLQVVDDTGVRGERSYVADEAKERLMAGGNDDVGVAMDGRDDDVQDEVKGDKGGVKHDGADGKDEEVRGEAKGDREEDETRLQVMDDTGARVMKSMRIGMRSLESEKMETQVMGWVMSMMVGVETIATEEGRYLEMMRMQ